MVLKYQPIFHFLILLIHFFDMKLLYIDPGTGSAIFSILIGATATLYFLFRAILIKLKVLFSSGKKIKHSFSPNLFVIYNEGKQYSNVFEPVLNEFESRCINLLYLTSSEDDPFFNNTYHYIKCEYIGNDNMAYARLNMLNAGIVLMTTPGLDVYQLKRSKSVKHYSHVLHAPSDATMYRLFGLDYFDSVLLTGDYQAKDIRILEKKRGTTEKLLVTTGCTYLDVYSEKISKIPKEENHCFTVLVSPSWGVSGILSKYGESLLQPLLDSDLNIIVRPHPQSKKTEINVLNELINKFKKYTNLKWDFEIENIYSLAKADIMISDYSGIIYDYIFLFDKPVIYINHGLDLRPYDADDLGNNALENLWQFRTLKEIGVELTENDLPNIVDIIQNVSESEKFKNARIIAKNTAWQFRGEAGKRIVDFMIDQMNI